MDPRVREKIASECSQKNVFKPTFYFVEDPNNPFPSFHVNVYEPKPKEYFYDSASLPCGSFSAKMTGYAALQKIGGHYHRSSSIHYVVKQFFACSDEKESPKAEIQDECNGWNRVYGCADAGRAYVFRNQFSRPAYSILVMPYMGRALTVSNLHRYPTDSPIEIISIRIAMLEGIAKLTHSQVYQGDLEPRNICLEKRPDDTYRAAIIDFGLHVYPATALGLYHEINKILTLINDCWSASDLDEYQIVEEARAELLRGMSPSATEINPSGLIDWMIAAQKFVYAKRLFLQDSHADVLMFLEPILTLSYQLPNNSLREKAGLLKKALTICEAPKKNRHKQFLLCAFKILLANAEREKERALIFLVDLLVTGFEKENYNAAFNEMDRSWKANSLSHENYLDFRLFKHLYIEKESKETTEASKLEEALGVYDKKKGLTQTKVMRDLRYANSSIARLKLDRVPTSFIQDILALSDARKSFFRNGAYAGKRCQFFNELQGGKLPNPKLKLSASEQAIKKLALG